MGSKMADKEKLGNCGKPDAGKDCAVSRLMQAKHIPGPDIINNRLQTVAVTACSISDGFPDIRNILQCMPDSEKSNALEKLEELDFRLSYFRKSDKNIRQKCREMKEEAADLAKFTVVNSEAALNRQVKNRLLEILDELSSLVMQKSTKLNKIEDLMTINSTQQQLEAAMANTYLELEALGKNLFPGPGEAERNSLDEVLGLK